ncbi:MAG: cell division protein FtsA [Peptococcaceae bacterium]|nr:MAG: cell division protein FtsA [Peptococcaceae bacterium]
MQHVGVLELALKQVNTPVNTVAGLDIGTGKTVAVIAEGNFNSFRIIGFGECPTVGMRKGVVVDVDNVARSIQQAIKKAEKMAGMKVLSAYTGYAGTGVVVRRKRFMLAIDGIRRGIDKSGNESMLLAIKPEKALPGEKILHIMPGESGGEDAPVIEPGGIKLEAMVIAGCALDLQKLVQSVVKVGLTVKEIVFNPLAASVVLLGPLEKEWGVIQLTIGAGTTSVTVFRKGSVAHTVVLPVGGEYITSDLAIGLHTSLAQAEEVQKNYGRVGSAVNVAAANIPAEEVSSIIKPRLSEILDLVKDAIESFRYMGLLPGGVVLAGGVSLLPGLPALVESHLNLPVRVGVVKAGDLVQGPAYAECVGLIKYGFSKISTGGLRYA